MRALASLVLFSSVTLLACQYTVADPPPCGDFQACTPEGPPELPHAVAVDAAGNAFVVGQWWDPGGTDPAFYVKKLDPTGHPIWSRTYGDGAFADEYRLTAALDAEDNLVIAGELVG